MEHVERPHPFGVALGEIVVDGHHVYAAAGERAQEHRQRGHEGLALTGCHFGDFALMEDYAAYYLDVVVHHVPLDFVAAGNPVVFPDGFVAFDAYEVASGGGQIAVHLGGGYLDCFIGGEACGGFAHGGEHYRKFVVEDCFESVGDVFLMFVDLIPERLALVDGQCFDFGLEAVDFFLVGLGGGGYVGAHAVDVFAQLVDA